MSSPAVPFPAPGLQEPGLGQPSLQASGRSSPSLEPILSFPTSAPSPRLLPCSFTHWLSLQLAHCCNLKLAHSRCSINTCEMAARPSLGLLASAPVAHSSPGGGLQVSGLPVVEQGGVVGGPPCSPRHPAAAVAQHQLCLSILPAPLPPQAATLGCPPQLISHGCHRPAPGVLGVTGRVGGGVGRVCSYSPATGNRGAVTG